MNERINGRSAAEDLKLMMQRAFVGNDATLDLVLAGFLSGLHVLVEDIPGVGKTTLARSLAKAAGLDYARIQFTPDLLPGDITGVTVWSPEKREFVFKTGAIMHQFILADEVNRASSRTQSALLEAMQERSVTVDGRTYPLPDPFFVVATQNPLNFSGTFQLPEAQLDRFGISLSLGYPGLEDEVTILGRVRNDALIDELEPVTTPDIIMALRREVREVRVDRRIEEYAVRIADRTRKSESLKLGMSPRATGHLVLAAQARAYLSGRDYVVPEDVVEIVVPVVQHRLIPTAQSRLENATPTGILMKIVSEVPKPSGL